MEEQTQKIKITLKIAGSSYSFNINREKEEIYRLAEREVNACLAQTRQNPIKGWEKPDYLAMVSLNFALANLYLRQSRELGDEDLQRLSALDEELGAYLDSTIG